MSEKRYLITGLCMQGNKGGPAIALSLTHALNEHLPKSQFVFSVPGGDVFAHEREWAKKYGYEVIENIDLKNIIPPYSFKKSRRGKLSSWLAALKSCDAMIQMSAISYVGPPSATPKLQNLLSGRYMDFILCRMLGKTMLAWTQSYGPLSTKLIRFLARADLKRQPIIFCRGDDCLAAVKKLLPAKQAKSYPDIAVSLPYNQDWARQYLTDRSLPSGFLSLSPSAVIYNKSQGLTDENAHITQLVEICKHFKSKRVPILLVPHTFRPNNHQPGMCDFGTCLKLIEQLGDAFAHDVFLLKEDLSPIELKSIISLARMHIGGRYHSVVASLSSGVPSISLSWHPKYKDLMSYYEMSDYVVTTETRSLTNMIDGLIEKEGEVANKLKELQVNVQALCKQNIVEFSSLLKEAS